MAFQEMDKVKSGPAGTQPVMFTVHTLALHGQYPPPLFATPVLLGIGVSKSSCLVGREPVSTAQKYRHLTGADLVTRRRVVSAGICVPAVDGGNAQAGV